MMFLIGHRLIAQCSQSTSGHKLYHKALLFRENCFLPRALVKLQLPWALPEVLLLPPLLCVSQVSLCNPYRVLPNHISRLCV